MEGILLVFLFLFLNLFIKLSFLAAKILGGEYKMFNEKRFLGLRKYLKEKSGALASAVMIASSPAINTFDIMCLEDQVIRWEGRASYYSELGCLGCRPDRKMANGERFDENKLTLAFWGNRRYPVPLNTPVLVSNLDNGISEIAVVTDRGNFDIGTRRIADLSKGLADRIGLRTDESMIEVAWIRC